MRADERYFGKMIPRRKMVNRNGKLGVILPSDAWPTIPDGCTQMFDVDSDEVVKNTHLVDNNLVSAAEIDDLFDVAASSMTRKRKGPVKALARGSALEP